MSPTIEQAALVLFVGMGPVKVIVYYLAAIHDVDAATAARVAIRAVGTATLTALGLLVAGALLYRLLHLGSPALVTASGIVLLAYGIEVILRATPAHMHVRESEATLMQRAIYPMGVPLILNPAGIAATTIFSAEAADLGALAVLTALVLAMGLLDLIVLLLARPLGPRIPPEATLVLEQLLGVLLVAVAVELIVIGLAAFGIVDIPVRH